MTCATYATQRHPTAVPCPGRYRGLSCCLYMNDETMLDRSVSTRTQTGNHEVRTYGPRFPQPITIAIATARFTSPPELPPAHASTHAMLGNSPHAARMVPAYPAHGFVVAKRVAYPASATSEPTRMNGPRAWTRSERTPARTVVMHPAALGGTERSCAVVAEKPRPVMIVGRKRENAYPGMMRLGARYAVRGRLTIYRQLRKDPHQKWIPNRSHICGSRRAWKTNLRLNCLESPKLSRLRVSTSHALSSSVRNVALSGY